MEWVNHAKVLVHAILWVSNGGWTRYEDTVSMFVRMGHFLCILDILKILFIYLSNKYMLLEKAHKKQEVGDDITCTYKITRFEAKLFVMLFNLI